MASQRVAWTVLPNGPAPDGGLRVTLLASPRLTPNADKVLKPFDAWLDWPKALKDAVFQVHFAGVDVAIAAGQTLGPSRVDGAVGLPRSEVWTALFGETTPVDGFPKKNLAGTKIISFEAKKMMDLVDKLYHGLAVAADGELPKVSQIVNDPAWKDLMDKVRLIDYGGQTGVAVPVAGGGPPPPPDSETPPDVLGAQEGGGPPTFAALTAAEAADAPTAGGSTPTPTFADPDVQNLYDFQTFHSPVAAKNPIEQVHGDKPPIKTKWTQYEEPPSPKEADLSGKYDFHRILSAMNPHAAMLRWLGIAVDLVLDPKPFKTAFGAGPTDDVLTCTVVLSDVKPEEQASLRTRARFADGALAALPKPALQWPETRIEDGLLNLDNEAFYLLQADVDGAGLKVMNFARTLLGLEPATKQVDPVTKQEKETGAPSLRNAGLMLVQTKRAQALGSKFAENDQRRLALEAALNQNGTAPDLYAEDLVRGYRIDAWNSHTKRWNSLCQRRVTYEFGSGPLALGPVEDEGTLRLSATKNPDPQTGKDVYSLHEAVLSWTGWSLCVPPPGGAVLVDDTHAESADPVVPAEIPLRTRIEPAPGTLPRLRYGRSYWIRARAVDLAGNARPAPAQHDPPDPEPLKRKEPPYRRFDPLHPPTLALFKVGAVTEVPLEGESMNRIAIRSMDGFLDPSVPTKAEARRFALPPRVSAREAELHGALDNGGKVDATTFAMLSGERDLDVDDDASALRREKHSIPTPGGQPAEPIEFAVFRDGGQLPYLADPLPRGGAARFFRHPDRTDDPLLFELYFSGTEWPALPPFQIRVCENPAEVPRFHDGVLEVPLPKAIRAQIRLSMQIPESALDFLGIWNLLTYLERTGERRRQAVEGRNWMLTPWTTVEVVHATQRPLFAPKITSIQIERELDQTKAIPVIDTTCSVKSTDSLHLIGEYHLPTDQAAGPVPPGDSVHRDLPLRAKIVDPQAYVTRLQDPLRGGFAEHLLLADDHVRINAEAAWITRKPHEFGDTRYRRIEYRLDATTRFREYMPASILMVDDPSGTPDPATGQIPKIPTDENIKVTGPPLPAWIPNSAPPPAPHVLYVVPLFDWSRPPAEPSGTKRRSRKGGGLRVYLDRPWNATGYGEMLAVVLPPETFEGDPNAEPAGNPYKKYVTQWANDAVWESPLVQGLAPRQADFKLARWEPTTSTAWLPPDAPPDEAKQRPGKFRVKGLRAPGENMPRVDIAPHDVKYDDERQLWFCDIQIQQGWSYYPFIRLALARYQPTSVEEFAYVKAKPPHRVAKVLTRSAHLSNVVLADFMTLAADRWLTVVPTTTERQYNVTVYGPAYTDSSAYHETATASTRDIRGNINVIQSTPVSKTSVIRVWVERLEESRGEDFGWTPISKATVEKKPPPSAPGRKSSPAEVFRKAQPFAPKVRDERFYAEEEAVFLHGSMRDLGIHIPNLWDGTVTLPASGTGKRCRLVVAEYEHYIIDDKDPYEGPPHAHDERLIFVEHVELE